MIHLEIHNVGELLNAVVTVEEYVAQLLQLWFMLVMLHFINTGWNIQIVVGLLGGCLQIFSLVLKVLRAYHRPANGRRPRRQQRTVGRVCSAAAAL